MLAGCRSSHLLNAENFPPPFLIHHLQGTATAPGDAGQRVFRHDHWETGLFLQQPVDVLEQGATTGEHYAPFRHIGAQFRRGLLQCGLNGTHDAGERLLQGLQYLIAVEGKTTRNASARFRPLTSISFTSFPG